ncbi:UDP-glucose 6-dehydrogenase [Moraxella haemolytica]|uniref:UDP-glucose 6-dehydrogenase n=1 Tax=Moraxella TaxID=475 RepID=UPI002542BB2A|nr:UDP-glucose 6-dehydrogenase [Moraxella sp. ZY171148]WII95349.1 UDP-glucose 6-dehydrogenase [Moraxella sp. ZY171148]
MKQIQIIGINHESINTAIFLASHAWQVSILASQQQIDEVLMPYQFDRQLSLLWQFYVTDNKIIIQADLKPTPYYWLFFDEHHDNDCLNLDLNPSSQVILSGAKPLGFFDDFAERLATNWVYYVPFNFLKDGNNFNAFFHIELLLIGEKLQGSVDHSDVLASLIKNSDKHYFADIKTVELARASIIGMLATRLSFINEMARLADGVGVNIKQIETMMGLDKRIGSHYLKAGWGFGGKTLPNELAHLTQSFHDNGVDTSLLKAVADVNGDQKELIFRKFWQYFNGGIENKQVVIWGAGYRTNTPKTTGSAIHALLKLCWAYDIKTCVYAVNTADELKSLYGDQPLFQLLSDPYTLTTAHALFIINWSENELIDMGRLNNFTLPIFDAKNVFDDEQVLSYKGFYTGVGK